MLRPSKVLSRQKLKEVTNRKHLGLGVEVIDGRGVVTASDEPRSAILDHLEAADGRLTVERINNKRRIVKEGTKHLVSELQTLLIMTENSILEGSKNRPFSRLLMRGWRK